MTCDSIGGEGRLTVLETDFPTARELRIDHLAVIDAPDGSRSLLHIEFQATADARMPKRIAVLTADGTSTDVIKAILGKIMRAPASERADALAQLVALSHLRGISPLIEQEYNAMPIVVSVEDSGDPAPAD
jgi:hypothetical protein